MTESMNIIRREVGPWPMNTYALVCPHTGESVLIDPGADEETLTEMLDGTTPIAILLTHTHPDHVGALDTMRSRLQVPLMAHAGPHVGDMHLDEDRTLADGDAVKVGEHTLRVYHTPGHTQDMICFYIEGENQAIVGDTIFAGGPGKTWSTDDFKTTLTTLDDVILQWPDETTCHPGHGPSFTIGEKRDAIERFIATEHGDFYGDAEWPDEG